MISWNVKKHFEGETKKSKQKNIKPHFTFLKMGRTRFFSLGSTKSRFSPGNWILPSNAPFSRIFFVDCIRGAAVGQGGGY